LPTLSEKLKALGVQLGTKGLTPRPVRQNHPIETVLPGQNVDTQAGSAYVVEQFFTPEHIHGQRSLIIHSSLEAMGRWAKEPLIQEGKLEDFAFLDTETSGLAGGTGTYAFLVGAGRYLDGQFQLAQFFMRDPSEEPAMLLTLESFLARSKILVTFNGKAFDVPLLNTRYTLQGWVSPLEDQIQLDLLHLARRLWRDRLPSRTLGNLEVQILDVHRSTEEVPGWMIPQIYFEYLQSGDARPMRNVFYHNAMDVLSMATLLDHTAELLASPFQIPASSSKQSESPNDLPALGRIYEDLNELDLATELYRQSLESGLPETLFWDTLQRLSFLHKRRGELQEAVILWTKAAQQGYIYAYIELAKVYEHIERDYDQAIHWTRLALEQLHQPNASLLSQVTWKEELAHRLDRLENKRNRHIHEKSS
jgi:uncharacterized protein